MHSVANEIDLYNMMYMSNSVNKLNCNCHHSFVLQEDIGVLGLQRLYAIDVHETMTDRLTIAWYANFERETVVTDAATLTYTPRSWPQYLNSKLRDPSVTKPSLLFDNIENMVYVSLPPPMLTPRGQVGYTLGESRLLGIKDMGNGTDMVFKTSQSAMSLVLYESNLDLFPNAGSHLWISTSDCQLIAIDSLGTVMKIINVNELLKTNCTITSKMTTARNREADEDFLLFGVHVPEPSPRFRNLVSAFGTDISSATPKNYVIGIDTPENANPIRNPDVKQSQDSRIIGDLKQNADIRGMPLSFMVPTPDDTQVFGQIIGITSINGDKVKEQLIVFSQIEGKLGKIFSISEKRS